MTSCAVRGWGRGGRARALAAALLAVIVAACPTPPTAETDRIPTGLTLSVSALSFDAIGATQAVSATVRDQNGQPMTGIPVSWESSSATVVLSPASASVQGVPGSRARTNLVGASVAITAAANGPATITASAGTTGALRATVTVEVAQVPVAPVKVAGDGQTGMVGELLAVPLQVRVQDRLGTPIANAAVGFAVTQGGGLVSAAEAVSGSDGIASSSWTLGPLAGPGHEAAASITGLSPATFGATAFPGPPAQIAVSGGGGEAQSAVVGSAVPV
ncbi:MAG TPA: hypothetical protein VI383_01215, partial [Gemmatimonadales bacterium]|nr:hypothetical protein [Gemmatimonadales bacterium]